MFTVRASSVQATRHVALNRPRARNARSPCAPARCVVLARSRVVVVVEVVRANRSMRFPDPPIVGYPSRGARARWLGVGREGNARSSFVCASFARARGRRARDGDARGRRARPRRIHILRPEMGPVRVETDLWN